MEKDAMKKELIEEAEKYAHRMAFGFTNSTYAKIEFARSRAMKANEELLIIDKTIKKAKRHGAPTEELVQLKNAFNFTKQERDVAVSYIAAL